MSDLGAEILNSGILLFVCWNRWWVDVTQNQYGVSCSVDVTNFAAVDSLSDGISYPDKKASLTRRQAVICRQYSSLFRSCGCKTWSLNSAGGCTVQYGPDDFKYSIVWFVYLAQFETDLCVTVPRFVVVVPDTESWNRTGFSAREVNSSHIRLVSPGPAATVVLRFSWFVATLWPHRTQ